MQGKSGVLPISGRDRVRSFPIDATTIVETILRMATGLRLEVVAEGVETPEQAALLEKMGCRQAQGFLWSRPVPPEEAARVAGLNRGHNLPARGIGPGPVAA